MTGRVLEEQRSVGRRQQCHERAAVATWTVSRSRRHEVVDALRRQRSEQERAELGHPRLLFLPRHPEIAEAHITRLRHLPLRPHATVLARIERDRETVAEVDRLAAGDADHPLRRHTRRLHQPHRLVAPDEASLGVRHDALGAPQVIEV